MIIFDLDGTLANCEHRRHFVDPTKREDLCFEFQHIDSHGCPFPGTDQQGSWFYAVDARPWVPDWKAFYEACDKDEPIWPVFRCMFKLDTPYEIWSGRCESVRTKTEDWLFQFMARSEMPEIKMRPIGDNTPDDQLKERWLDEALAQGKSIEFVFDDRPKVVRMWRKRGIFVFDVNQGTGDF